MGRRRHHRGNIRFMTSRFNGFRLVEQLTHAHTPANVSGATPGRYTRRTTPAANARTAKDCRMIQFRKWVVHKRFENQSDGVPYRNRPGWSTRAEFIRSQESRMEPIPEREAIWVM